MQSVINDFEDRVTELKSFFAFLRRLDLADELVSERSGKRSTTKIEAEWRATLKATAYLLIYNMVESSIRDAVIYLYGRVKFRQVSAEKLQDEIVAIWVEQEFRSRDAFSASARNYLELSRDLVKLATTRAMIDIRCEDLPLAGNLDGHNIIKLCEKHGLPFTVPKAARGGAGLASVKTARNALAHGSLSFEECGRNVTVAELEQIRKETVIFVRAVLRAFKTYTARRGFLKAS